MTPRIIIKTLLTPVLVLAGMLFISSHGVSAATQTCGSSGDLHYICGVIHAEDILPIGNSPWLVTSGMDGSMANTGTPGHIYLVNRRDKTATEFFPGTAPVFHQDKKLFGACPGPINPRKFSAHGIALQQQSPAHFRLYMTSHGEREAIEVFDISLKDQTPAIAWAGCVLLPGKVWSNSVAILSDGGFVTTNFMDPTVPNAFAEIMQGKISGYLLEWHPGTAVQQIPDTALSAPNGIALSADEHWMYVTAFGTREVLRYDRTAQPMTKTVIKVNVMPDDIHWGDDGLLYTVGMNYVAPDQCAKPPCSTGWSVISIDPRTFTATRVTGADQTATLQGASAAVPAGQEIWIGTYNGDRIGYLPKPLGN